MEPEKIKILLVDDQESVLKGLRMRLELEDDLWVTGEANDGFRALELAVELRPDIIVMDLEMPKMDGISAAKALHELAPEVTVIMLSMHSDPTLRARAREAGVWAFVEKREGAVNLIREIHRWFENKKSSRIS